MKNITQGKIGLISLIIITFINNIVYFIAKGSPFNFQPFESLWTFFTGISIFLSILALFVFIIYYIIYNWDKPLNNRIQNILDNIFNKK